MPPLEKLRNFGISAHIDSGKTTLTERILFYTGRISKIHEVGGKDGVGAVMDSMKLERERGITIKSAATFATWKDCWHNIIDTPGHIDFTVEVERSLRVLDGAILVVCSAGGVQSQTITVDRQMRRYKVPRMVFLNKLDRKEAKNVDKVVGELRSRLGLNCAKIQIPHGYGHDPLGHQGIVDVIKMKLFTFEGNSGMEVKEHPIPDALLEEAKAARAELIECLADVDPDVVGEKFLNEEEPTEDEIHAAIRKGVIELTFCPVLMGSAKANSGVQLLLDAVNRYLPNPTEVKNYGITVKEDKEEPVELIASPKDDLVAMAFKLDIQALKTITYVRVYQGTLRKGDSVRIAPRGSANWKETKTAKITRLMRMHSDKTEDVSEMRCGEICAVEGITCSSGDTLVSASRRTMISCESIFVPEPVISIQLFPKDVTKLQDLLGVLKQFEREDPTFKFTVDPETQDLVVSGMGELHLDIYVIRLREDFGIECKTGEPFVQYREYFPASVSFDHRHKHQSGGRGQFAQLNGTLEVIDEVNLTSKVTAPKNEFISECNVAEIPDNFQKSIARTFKEITDSGPLLGLPVWGLRMVLKGGQTHEVDSSDFAFSIATRDIITKLFEENQATLLEPVMTVSVTCPKESMSEVIGLLSARGGEVSDAQSGLIEANINSTVPLRNMFGFIGELRGATRGNGEFTMEYDHHTLVPHYEASKIIEDRKKEIQLRK